MRAFIRKSWLTVAIGLSLCLVSFATAQDAGKIEKHSPIRHETSGPETLDWQQFPQLKGQVDSASGFFSSFLPPKAGQAVNLDARNPKEVKVTFRKAAIAGRAPYKVHEVFWEPKTGDFRGMRLISEDNDHGVITRNIIDLHCPYKPGGQAFQGRFMNAVLVEEVDGRFRSVASIHFEFKGELPKRR